MSRILIGCASKEECQKRYPNWILGQSRGLWYKVRERKNNTPRKEGCASIEEFQKMYPGRIMKTRFLRSAKGEMYFRFYSRGAPHDAQHSRDLEPTKTSPDAAKD